MWHENSVNHLFKFLGFIGQFRVSISERCSLLPMIVFFCFQCAKMIERSICLCPGSVCKDHTLEWPIERCRILRWSDESHRFDYKHHEFGDISRPEYSILLCNAFPRGTKKCFRSAIVVRQETNIFSIDVSCELVLTTYSIFQFFIHIVNGYCLLRVSNQLCVIFAFVLLVITIQHIEL